jgi:hypothetical protein
MGLYADHEHGMVDAAVAQAHAAAAGLSVDAENVLYVRKAILEEHEELIKILGSETRDISEITEPYGKDPVSLDASVAFPQRAALLFEQCKQHVANLLAMADELQKAAVAYGLTEDDIVASSPVNTSAALAAVNATIHSILNPWERG